MVLGADDVASATADKKGDDDKPDDKSLHFHEVAFDVMEWPPHVEFDAIIGIDFLVRAKAKIDLVSFSMTITDAKGNDQIIPLRQEK